MEEKKTRTRVKAALAILLAAVLFALPTFGVATYSDRPQAVLSGDALTRAREALPFEAQTPPAEPQTEAEESGVLPDAAVFLTNSAPGEAAADEAAEPAGAPGDAEPLTARAPGETPEPASALPAEPASEQTSEAPIERPSEPAKPTEPAAHEPAEPTPAEPATDLAFNTRVSDTIASILETKRYRLTVAERGAIQFAFDHPTGDLSACRWYVRLYALYSPDGTGKTTEYRELQTVVYTRLGEAVLSGITGVLPGEYLLTVDCATGFTTEPYELVAAFSAAGLYEYECNDTPSRYTELPCDMTYTGTSSAFLDERRDEDWYLFRVTEKGYCVVDLTHDALQTANWSINAILWKIEVLTPDGTELWSDAQTASQARTSSGVLGLSAGVYFIHITSVNRVDAPYAIRSTFTYEPITELEINDSQTAATPIEPAKTVTAALSRREGTPDEDWYAFTMEQDGVMMLSFSHESVDNDRDAWRVTIRTGDGHVIYSILSKRNDTESRSPYLGLAAGTYYIRIDSDGLYRAGQVYGLQYRSVYAADWESESNDDAATADPIAFGTETFGTLVEVGVRFDTDWFVFDFDGGDLNVIFRHEGEAINRNAWTVTVLDAQMKELTSLPINRLETVRELPLYGIAAGTYYLRVSTGEYFSQDRYSITVTKP